MNRRNFLKASSATAMSASMLNLGGLIASKNARAATDEDYKALVCVFLYGGMDNHDTVIPFDETSYNQWAQIRASMLSQYSTSRARNNLLPLSTPARFGERQFALPPEMTGLSELYSQGKMAIMGNVGPLVEPTNATTFNNQTARVPARLFSHNDQQSTWMSGTTEGAQVGWAGQLNDALIQNGQTDVNTFSAITTTDGELLLTGQQTSPYRIEGSSAVTIDAIEETDAELSSRLTNHFSMQNSGVGNILQQDMANKINQSYAANSLFDQALSSASDSTATFPASPIGRQLEAVAKTISARSQLQGKRQMFMVAMGGFDTHSGQAQSLPVLQMALDRAVSAFQTAMDSMNLSQNVTLFTASDFGRTLAVNGDGTDHGWGAHHFVVGGAVNGGQIFGDIPPSTLNHELDSGSGRLIPTASVEQYAANFGGWLGLSESELNSVFPNLANFNERPELFTS
ncbi:DUF1501 domain-containing protein [Thalassotalea euphylliae]|uniref:DUF1501 domain-containing protein n=1 Tax=Thalassotalea euphylliae TaxID=1655234 RepID=UPI00363FFE43